MKRYNDLKSFLFERYGVKMVKISLDGGFTCPNRDGSIGWGGCIFCDERGAREKEPDASEISLQISKKITELLEKREAEKFIAYFQNFSGSYDKVSNLKEKYSAALTDKRVAVLSIGTRPDCINGEILQMLSALASEKGADVWIELGLQTSGDKTAELINRCYKSEIFPKAVGMIKSYGFSAVVHLMFGLPGEDEGAMLNSVKYTADTGVDGIKLHAASVMRGTVLEKMFRGGRYKPLTREEYVNIAAKAIALLPPEIVVHRLVSSCKTDLLVAPDWVRDKPGSLIALEEKFEADDIVQGKDLNVWRGAQDA
ncbi:MAG: TIGR01212 family radical SAM protein [Deferribacteraceae bacterium]|jgi:radical SAM protein (TIGR01212 family)|nr:TIGR01212 family radical SAM protein [Deferribacteraceae bacterium]